MFRPRSGRGLLARLLVFAVVVTGGVAATTAVAGLLKVQGIVNDLTINPSVPVAKQDLQIPKPGAPQTFLLIGSDHRAGEKGYHNSRSDTMLLVRLNAASSTINVMSIPRDLQVEIPGYGSNKINAAYTFHGPDLVIKTIRAEVFPQFKPNHVVDVNFGGFADLVNAIGCVYSDVDHRYYNQSSPPGTADNFASINIRPGYQRLCGGNNQSNGALSFVRFRHTDSDLTREARQQDFLRWAKSQFPVSRLVSEGNHLARIFGQNSETDRALHSLDGALNVATLLENMESKNATIKQIPFPAVFTPCPVPCTVVPKSQAALQSAWRQFMHVTAPAVGAAARRAHGHHHHRRLHRQALSLQGVVADTADGRAQAQALSHAKLPVYYPRLIAKGSSYCSELTANCNDGDEPATAYEHSYPRAYTINGPGGAQYKSYRMTLVQNYLLGRYYGVQGTTWDNPPLLSSPSGSRVIHGRKLFLYKDGSKLTQVAWHHDGDAYWISNNLTENLSNDQMLAIAASLTPYRR